LEKLSETEFQAVATNKIGPVKARFKGKVRLSDLDPPNGYKISGEGDGGIAGFAKGGATVKLTEKDGGTLLSYHVEAQIGGKLAQLGQRLINGVAKKLADDFFAKFAETVK
jgi:carbon monoxide dehydrogenase subunit G